MFYSYSKYGNPHVSTPIILILGFLAPGFYIIFYPPNQEESGIKQQSSDAGFMMVICICVGIANIWPIFIAWKARKEVNNVYKQEEPTELAAQDPNAQECKY